MGDSHGKLFCEYFDVTERGNFEGQNILHIKSTIEEVAGRNKVAVEDLKAILDAGRQKLFALRELRIKPGRDEKVLTAWNGLMLASFAEGAAILERVDYLDIARNNARFLLEQLQRGGLLLRTYKDGEAKLNGYLEDYACLIDGLISLYEASGELTWIESAISLADKMIEQFWDENAGGFFFTGQSHEQLIVRSKDFMDNATPSGNSTATLSLLKLSLLTGNEDYRRRGTAVLRLIAEQLRRYPSAFGLALCAVDFYLASPLEIVIVGSPGARLNELIRTVWQRYIPNRVLALCRGAHDQAASVIPVFVGRNTLESQPTVFVCQASTCKEPATSAEDLLRQIVPAALSDSIET